LEKNELKKRFANIRIAILEKAFKWTVTFVSGLTHRFNATKAARRNVPIVNWATLTLGTDSVQAFKYAITMTPLRNAETSPEDPYELKYGIVFTHARFASIAEVQIAKMMKLSFLMPEIAFDIEYVSNNANVSIALAMRCVKSL
jgi:hypothetical protein